MKQIQFLLCMVLLLVLPNVSAQQNLILPKPQSVVFTGGQFSLPTDWGIYHKNAKATASYLSAALEDRFEMNSSSKWFRNSATVVLVNSKKDASSEAYTLVIDGRRVRLEAASEKGLF